jgi:glutathione S-transferase
MLTFYYTPLSVYSRPVWVALLEKKLTFDLVSVKLDGDQFQPGFLRINPFNHVPVLVDDGFQIVESIAILDYIEVSYPIPPLLPTEVRDLTIVRMVEMLTMNELIPAMLSLIIHYKDLQKLEQAKRRANTVLNFLEENLGDRSYFGNDSLSLAEIVAGGVVPWLPNLGVSLTNYPRLSIWSDRLMQREAWKITQPNSTVFEEWKRHVRVLSKVRQRQHRQLAK